MSDVEVSEPMRRLRKALDERGTRYEVDDRKSCGTHREQTLWVHHGGETASVIWIRQDLGPGMLPFGLSYGWPVMLECWPDRGHGEPEAMTVDEILARCCDE